MNEVSGNPDNPPSSILIVDDDPRDLKFTAAIVRSVGYAILVAEGGEQALALIAERRPDLLLLDLLMPGMDGFEVIKRLKANEANRDLRVIVITGIDDHDLRLRALELGADELLTKPIHRAELLLRIGNQLRLQEYLRLLADHNRRLTDEVEARTAELAKSNARLEFLIAENPAVIYTSQMSGDYAITWMSPNIATLLGYTSAECTEAPGFWTARIHPDDRGRVFADLQSLSETDRCILEYRFRHADGNWRWIHDEPRLLRETAGESREIVGYWVDCSERKWQEERIGYLTTHDSLTGLPNEALLVDRLDRALLRARRESVRVAFLVLNIDGFALFNQTLGIDGADLVIKQLAERFRHCLHDVDTVARSGGAGFEIILPDIEDEADVATLARKLLDALSWPLEIGEQTVFVTACIGIALFPGDGDDFASLSAAAASALVGAKKEGRDRIKFYAAEMSHGAASRLSLEAALRRALERDELLLHYQPRVDLRTGGICGAEALLRWRYEGKLMPPGIFITLAEDTGLILPIGEWVLFEVCRQQREWLDRHLSIVTLAVNVSERQLHARDARTALPSICRQYLEAMALPAQRLELEVTESLIMQDAEKSIPMLTELRRLGIKLAVDDFGTGYSSLAYLKRLPIDYLKIDRSFVMNVTTDPDDASIAFTIINLAHNLHLAVIAEGVETEGQLEYLRRHGCDQMQGFYFSQPLPADEFAELLGSGRALAIPADDFTPTVLLLDSDEGVLGSMKRLLLRDGYRILATTDPDDALELLAKNTVQVLVTDPSMAKISGIDFLSRVKELHPSCIRIVLSGHTELQRIAYAINRGAIWRFMAKPWNDDSLREEIRRAFHEYKKRIT